MALTQLISYDGFDVTNEVARVSITDANRVQAAAVAKRHGGIITDIPVRDAKRVTLTGTIYGRDYDVTNPHDGARARVDAYNAISMRYNKRLRFHTDRYLNAYPLNFAHEPVLGSAGTVETFTWDFICLDPFWYADPAAPTIFTLNSSDSLLDITNSYYQETQDINNIGSTFIYPVVTVAMFAAGSKTWRVQFDNLTTGKFWRYEFAYVGGTNRTLIVDAGQFSVQIDGNDDLTNWQGTFVWLDPGVNSIRVSGSIDATYTVAFTPRYG